MRKTHLHLFTVTVRESTDQIMVDPPLDRDSKTYDEVAKLIVDSLLFASPRNTTSEVEANRDVLLAQHIQSAYARTRPYQLI